MRMSCYKNLVKISWKIWILYEYSYVGRCYQCGGLNHKIERCENFLHACAVEQNAAQWNSELEKCSNCKWAVTILYHPAYVCPTDKRMIERINLYKIQYLVINEYKRKLNEIFEL